MANPRMTGQKYRVNEGETVRVLYATSFFESIPYTTYSTYLEGFDRNWSDWSEEEYKEYGNLPPGNYTFRVKSKNLYDVEGTEASVRLAVNHRNWLQNGGWLLVGSLLPALLLILFFSVSTRSRGRRMKEDLELKQEQLERYHSEAKHWQTEKEHLNQQLSVANLQREVHAGLVQKIENLARNNPGPKALRNAVDEFLENLKEVDLQIDAHQSVEAGDFLSKIKDAYPGLSARELRLCSYLRLNVSSKEIAGFLGISVRGVESLRYRVRKKFGLKKEQDLTEFILQI